MGIWQAPTVTNDMGLEQIRNLLAILIKDVDYIINGNIDSKNAREMGGWIVGLKQMESKDKTVGMSTEDDIADPVRFWAGDIRTGQPLFYVTKSGKLFAANGEFRGKITAESGTIGGFTIDLDKLSGAGIIEGGTFRTAAPGHQRVEISAGSFSGYTADDRLSGLVFNPDKVNDIIDLFLYHRGAKLVEFYDGITHYAIRPASGSNGLTLGGSFAPTFASGDWDFTGCTSVSGTIPGNCASANYAASAGTATSMPSTGVTPGSYPKVTVAADGRVTDGGTLAVSDIPTDSTHRMVSDEQVNNWNGKASKTLPPWTAPTLLNSWINFGSTYAPVGYYKDDMSIVRLRGLPKGGTMNQPIFILPAGSRPAYDMLVPSYSNAAFGAIQIKSTGEVIADTGSNAWISLENTSFRAEL